MAGNSSILHRLSAADVDEPHAVKVVGLVHPQPGATTEPTATPTAPAATARLLAHVEAIRSGDGAPGLLLAAFRAATVYGHRPEDSAYAAMLVRTGESSDGAWLPVYSSLAQLENAEGACAWWCTSGADLLDTSLPALTEEIGPVCILLDRAGATPLALLPPDDTPTTNPGPVGDHPAVLTTATAPQTGAPPRPEHRRSTR